MAYVIKIKYENSLRRLTIQNPLSIEKLSFVQLETRIRELLKLPATAEMVVTYTDKENDVVTMTNDEDVVDALDHQALNPLRVSVTVRSTTYPDPNASPVDKGTASDAQPSKESQRFKLSPGYSNSLHRGRASSNQFSGVVENTLQEITSKFASAVKNVAAVAAAVTSESIPGSTTLPKNTTHHEAGAKGSNVENVVHQGVSCDICNTSPIVGLRWKSLKKLNFDLCNNCFQRHGNENEYSKIDQPMFRPRHFQQFHPAHRMMRTNPAMGPTFHPMGPHGYGGRSFGMRGPLGGRHCHPMGGLAGKLDARFVCDVTMFDGTEVAPGMPFTKIWRLRNNGTISWPPQSALVFVGGDEMSQVYTVPLEIPELGLVPEGEMEVSVDLVAPEKPGRYVSHWRLASPTGPKFGHRVWVLVQVVPKEALDQPAELRYNIGADVDAQPEVKANSVEYVPRIEGSEIDSTAGVKETESDTAIVVEEKSVVKDSPATATDLATDLGTTAGGQETEDTPTADSPAIKSVFELAKEEASTAAASETPSTEEVTRVGDAITYPVLDVTRDAGPVTYPAIEPLLARGEDRVETDADSVEGEDLSSSKAILAKLEAMGFTDGKLNLELLEKNNLDLRKTLDDLCAAEEWDPILGELEEMGFNDTNMNRRLMFKNNGSVKLVVKDLVQMYKDPQGKGKQAA